MPGFRINSVSDKGDVIAVPKAPIYTYTWKFERLAKMENSGVDPKLLREIYAKEATLPDFNHDVEEYQGPSIKYKYAKGIVWNDVKVTFYDTAGIYKILKGLRQTVWTPREGLKTANEYKGLSEIAVFQGDDRTLEVKWQLFGSWVKAVNWANLTYTSSEIHSVTVTLAYDWAEEDDPNTIASLSMSM